MSHAKSSYSRYLKKLKTIYPNNKSVRNPLEINQNRLTHREFKLVLPMAPKDNVSLKGANTKPVYPCVESMNLMISCLKSNDYNESQCSSQVKEFIECYDNFTKEMRLANEQDKKGIFNVNESQGKLPVKFMQKMMHTYKLPKKVDNGPDIPIERIANLQRKANK